jgi:hypothetical protein
MTQRVSDIAKYGCQFCVKGIFAKTFEIKNFDNKSLFRVSIWYGLDGLTREAR